MIEAATQAGARDMPIELRIRRPDLQRTATLSVIIPLAPMEDEPDALLAALPDRFEVILARGGSRASSMNRATAAASGPCLWFVHADTVLEDRAIAALEAQLPSDNEILYFDLHFDRGGLMRLTELGVLIRSRLLGLPFGDQALCLSRTSFEALGGYDERIGIGEDHMLVRKARRAGLAIRPVGATILTSARKYRQHGWLRTTCRHLFLTVQQALQRN